MANQPLYRSVRDQIVEGLVRREWRPGDAMPSERQLAARYGVGISTIRAAIGELETSNVLIRMQGKGTFVAQHGARENRYRFFNVVRNSGVKEPFHRELLSLKREKADARSAAALQLPAGPRSLEVFKARIRLEALKEPFAVADLTVSAQRFPGLDANGIPDGEGSLYSLYQATYGVNVIKVVEQFVAVMPPATIVRMLKLPQGEPVLEIRRVAYTFNDEPVELRATWVRTKHCHYMIAQGGS